MGGSFVDICILRIFLPLSLLFASHIRFNGFSLVYLIMLLACPFLCIPKCSDDIKFIQIFLSWIVTLSCIFTIAHPTFNIILALTPASTSFGMNCTEASNITSQIGLIRLTGIPALRTMRLVLPDPGMLLVSVILLIYFSRKNRHISLPTRGPRNIPLLVASPTPTLKTQNSEIATDEYYNVNSTKQKTLFSPKIAFTQSYFFKAWVINTLYYSLALCLLCLAGITSPSLIASIYMLCFLGGCTYWAYHHTVGTRNFGCLRALLLIYSFLHICITYIYQFNFFQTYLPDGSVIARVLGFYYIFRSSCETFGEISFVYDRGYDAVAPFIVLLLYYVLALKGSRFIMTSNDWNTILTQNRPALLLQNLSLKKPAPLNETLYNENTILEQVRVDSPTPEPVSTNIPLSIEAPNTSYINHKPGKSIPIFLHTPHHPKQSEDLLGAERPFLLSFHYSAVRNSYILSLMAMMAWSITYSSWLTFILLIFACLLWMMPNSRKAVLHCSPYIVAYAIFLILLNYAICFNLDELKEFMSSSNETTETTVPISSSDNRLKINKGPLERINWGDFGFTYTEYPLFSLGPQIIYLTVFWLTLRLHMIDGLEKSSNLRQRVTRILQQRNQRDLTKDRQQNNNEHDCTVSLNQQTSQGIDSSVHYPNYEPISPSAWFGFTDTHLGTHDNAIYRSLTSFLHQLCVHYWILFCCTILVVISVQQPVVICRMIYMLLLIYFLALFQLNYQLWRRQMLVFWWLNIAYSILWLLCIYTYQFQGMDHLWSNFHLDEQKLKDIGIERFDRVSLFQRLMTPTVFIVCMILQVHYFHQPFLECSYLKSSRSFQMIQDIPSQAESHNMGRGAWIWRNLFRRRINNIHESEQSVISTSSNFIEDFNTAFNLLLDQLEKWFRIFKNCIWRILEVHWIKVLTTFTMVSVCTEISAPNIAYVFVVVLLLPFKSLHRWLATFIFIWSSCILLLKMGYQLESIQDIASNVCPNNYSTKLKKSESLAYWLGLTKEKHFTSYIIRLTLLMACAVFYHVIFYRQLHERRSGEAKTAEPPEGIIFQGVSLEALDLHYLTPIIKCLFNYTFYKLGLELCLCVTIITACLRADAVSILYIILSLVFIFAPRNLCIRLWPLYLFFLGFLLPLQYILCVGLPKNLCFVYPWENSDTITQRLLRWLYLPTSTSKLNPWKLLADFFQFIFVSMQYRVFILERQDGPMAYGGGSNQPDLKDTVVPPPEEKDFISSKECYLDYLMHSLFYWSYWVSLAIVFLTGITSISLFCLGYIILSFIYLWIGQNVMLNGHKSLILSWNVIVGYNVFVILTKCILQYLSCVQCESLSSYKKVISLFGLHCIDPGVFEYEANLGCVMNRGSNHLSGLNWDVFCFVIIIFQRKIFLLKSFIFVVFDLKVQSQFASRGAYLINKKLMLMIQKQNLDEKRRLEKVREKIDRIAKRQSAFRHSADQINEHYILLRSGDYFMFEADPEEEDNDSSYVHDLHTTVTRIIQKQQAREQNIALKNAKCYSQTSNSFTTYPETNLEHSSSIGSTHLQHHALESAWSRSGDRPVMDFLGNYTDPYSSLNIRQAETEKRSKMVVEISSKSGEVNPIKDPLKQHRRLRSQPDIISTMASPQKISALSCESNSNSSGNSHFQDDSDKLCTLQSRKKLVVKSNGLHSYKKDKTLSWIQTITDDNKYPLDEDVFDTPEKRPPYRSHRRISSATAVLRTSDKVDALKKTDPIIVIDAPPKLPNTSSRKRSIREVNQSNSCDDPLGSKNDAIKPRDEAANSESDNDEGSLYDEDDDNPPELPATANPFFLINQVMEKGPRTCVRRYKRSLLAAASGYQLPASGGQTQAPQGKNALVSPNTEDQPPSSHLTAPSCRDLTDLSYGGSSKRNIINNQDQWNLPKSEEPLNYSSRHITIKSANVSPKKEEVAAKTLDAPEDEYIGDRVDPSCWSKFKAYCEWTLLVIALAADRAIRIINLHTRDHRRIRDTINAEKQTVKHRLTMESVSVNVTVRQQPSQNPERTQFEQVAMEVMEDSSKNFFTSFLQHFTLLKGRTPGNQNVHEIKDHVDMTPEEDYDYDPSDKLLIHDETTGQVITINPEKEPVEQLEELEYIFPSIYKDTHHVSIKDNVINIDGPQIKTTDGRHKREREFRRSRSRLFLLVMAVGNLAIYYSEMICYALLILNHMFNASVLSLPFPLIVFLWAMLSVPRPSKTFWIFLITYTELLIVVKYIFKFEFAQYNSSSQASAMMDDTLLLARLFGVEVNENYLIYDLVQLFFIFLHRAYLKNNGLWRDHVESTRDLEIVVKENDSSPNKVPRTKENGQASPPDTPPEISFENEEVNTKKSINVPKYSNWNPFHKVFRFYIKMTDPRYNIKVDVYIYMFLFEFLSLLVIIFGFTAFGPKTGMGDNAFEYLKANKIPMYFVYTGATQFMFLIVDRALFLRKNVLGKFIFQLFHVILIHIWLFFLLPSITKLHFRDNIVAKLLYVIKCVYFGLSAYQIRSNYPHRILGNFLTKNYNYLNMILFKAYMILPFLYEMRSVMDWMWTRSTLSLYHWMQLEDIFAKLFIMKCWRRCELEYPTPRGNNRSYFVKYLVGGLVIAFVFLCLWLPIFVSSFIEMIYVYNVPDECSYSIAFGGFTPFFIFTARTENMFQYSPVELKNLTDLFENDREAYGFIKSFETQDIVKIVMPKYSDDNWSISQRAKDNLITKLICNSTTELESTEHSESGIRINFVMKCRRPIKEVESSSRTIEEVFSRLMTPDEQCNLSSILKNPSLENQVLKLDRIFPKYVFARADRLTLAPSGLGSFNNFENVSFAWEHHNQTTSNYWTIVERDNESMSMCSFNARVSDNVFGKLFRRNGILGFYAAYLLFASRLLRMLYNNIAYVVCLEELPHVDRVLNMCHEIYLVREYGLLRLEEQLYAKLLFLYRSSETMIKWTRHPRYLVAAHTDPSIPESAQQIPPIIRSNSNSDNLPSLRESVDLETTLRHRKVAQ